MKALKVKLEDGTGELRVIGRMPKYKPYVWIGAEDGGMICTIDIRQMDALVRRWRKAMGKVPSK